MPSTSEAGAWSALERRAVVARSCRVLYVPTPKVASTPMLWLLARAEGDPEARLEASVYGPTPAVAIHDPVVHGLPLLGELSPADRAEALTSDRWVRLGLTRDPYARLFSGWQHSVLLQTPGRMRFDAPDLVADGAGHVDLAASFRAFVRFLDERWSDLLADQHFRPQLTVLSPDLVEYTELVPATGLPGALARLARHAPALAVGLGPANESLGIDHRRCYDTESAAVVARRYRADFEELGYDPEPPAPAAAGAPPTLDTVGRRLLAAVHERNERIDLLRRGQGPRWELVRQQHRVRRSLRRLRTSAGR